MKQSGRLNRFIELIARIFGPVIPVLTAAGVLKGLLVLATATGVLSTEQGTYRILYALADGFFYYLPVFLAFSGAKEFGANPFTGAFVALALLYPELTAAMAEGLPFDFLRIPVISVTYSSSILPVFMAVAFLGKVEPWFEKRLPELVKSFGVPLCAGGVVYLATLLVFGPVGAVIGSALAGAYQWAYHISPVVAGTILSGVFQPFVICGFHWSIFPICIENIAKYGEDTLMAIISTGVYSQAGAVLAVMLWSKDAKQRTICLSAGITALFGTTEPAIFGANLPLKKPFLAACLGAAVGGGIIGLSGATAKAFAFPNLVTLPVFMGKGFGLYLAGCAASFVVAGLLTLILLGKNNGAKTS